MKAKKNKTIDMSVEDGSCYLEKCLSVTNKTTLNKIINKTILGNTFDVMPLLPKKFIDLAIIDPPYNMDKNFNGISFKKTSDESYYEYTEKWIITLLPLLKDCASVYVCCDWQSSPIVGMVLKKYFIIHNRITWQREKGRGALHNWKNGMEDIWFASVSKNYTFNTDKVKIRRKVVAPYKVDGLPKGWEETETGRFRNTYPSNFWDDISVPYWSMPENTAHPTQKPEKLLAKLILASSNENDIVFDPFLGSGSTSVVSKKLNRKYVGIEQNKQYCVWSEKRLEMANQDSSIQGYTNGIFWERNTLLEQNKYMKGKKNEKL